MEGGGHKTSATGNLETATQPYKLRKLRNKNIFQTI